MREYGTESGVCTVSRGHLENRDPAAMHHFLGFPRRSGTVMHHFLNGLPQLTHTISVERGFVRIARHQGPDPSRSEASRLDFPLEIASQAFNPANFFAARPSSCTVSYPETGKCVAPFLNVTVSKCPRLTVGLAGTSRKHEAIAA